MLASGLAERLLLAEDFAGAALAWLFEEALPPEAVFCLVLAEAVGVDRFALALLAPLLLLDAFAIVDLGLFLVWLEERFLPADGFTEASAEEVFLEAAVFEAEEAFLEAEVFGAEEVFFLTEEVVDFEVADLLEVDFFAAERALDVDAFFDEAAFEASAEPSRFGLFFSFSVRFAADIISHQAKRYLFLMATPAAFD